MTRVIGFAMDIETGEPVAKRLVYATLLPREAAGYLPPEDDPAYIDETVTETNGRWELNLRPTVGTAAYYRLRVWLESTVHIDVPAPTVDDETVDVETILIPLPDPGEPPPVPGPYVMRTELGVPSGVAQLGPDGKLKFTQRPSTGGGGGENNQYTHSQFVAQSVWTVNHNFGYFPTAWSLFDENGTECDEYIVQHMDEDTLRVAMDVATAGEIRLI